MALVNFLRQNLHAKEGSAHWVVAALSEVAGKGARGCHVPSVAEREVEAVVAILVIFTYSTQRYSCWMFRDDGLFLLLGAYQLGFKR